MIQITEQVESDLIILTLSGRFEFQTRKPFQTAIETAKRSNPHQIILNFSHVPFINSAGLGLLMLAHNSLKEDNIHLSLEVTEGYVLQVLTLTGIGEKIPITVIHAKPLPVVPPTITPASKTPLTPPLIFESADMQDLLVPILERLEKNDLDLPTLPEVATQVMALTTDPDATAHQLTTIIQRDSVLTAKIFQLTSSAAYGARQKIETLPQAIAWLGLNSVEGLAFALSVQSGVFNDRGYEREVRALWAHAIATAYYAKSLAGMTGRNRDTAFLCGLLHSIGKLFVVHTVNQSRSSSASRLPWSAMLTLIEQSYIEVGRQLADAWNFPSPVKEAINLHQHYSYHLATDPSQGAALTCLARHLATYHLDSVAVSEETLRALPVASTLQIPHDVMDGILEIKTAIQAQIDSLLI